MLEAKKWIQDLKLEPHQEGGYFKQIYKSDRTMNDNDNQDRALYTSIYFLLQTDNPSNFHRLTADEIWYYHTGVPLTIHMIFPTGVYTTVELGIDAKAGQHLQFTVPKGTIFGSTIEEPNSYALVSCMVSPGFEYEDFELFKREELIEIYPQYEEIIKRLTTE